MFEVFELQVFSGGDEVRLKDTFLRILLINGACLVVRQSWKILGNYLNRNRNRNRNRNISLWFSILSEGFKLNISHWTPGHISQRHLQKHVLNESLRQGNWRRVDQNHDPINMNNILQFIQHFHPVNE
ncbi:hypothetical protein ACJIZ3_003779 [Penstemon smallii]|uniref:Uncharacterized protein n=1 Tax=Penstemon smallii TaxID=265156 RepID=A0ABD3S067_9LAMI